MGKMGKYIYGIIPRHCSGQVNCIAEKSFDSFLANSSEEVCTVSFQDIAAVVTDSEIVDYTRLLKDAVARYLIKHQQVIEKLMENFTIIPMRLGTFASDEDEVRYILAKAYPRVKDIFNKISDKIEIDVAATWSDFNSILKEIGEEKEIKEIKERLSANPKGVTLDEQMKIGVMVKKTLDKKREKYAGQIQKALTPVSQDFKAHGLMDDKMVVNSAFLINKHEYEDFERIIEELNTEFHDELNFRCVGPLPPYSFYTLEVKKMQFKELDWARKRLGLVNDFVTKSEIKKAHQAKAFALHPDMNPNVPGIEREFDDATKAYKTLWEYCQGDSCSFNEDEFRKNAILVKVRE
ncbi:MAG: GvpL/GvpF family gas vesicle protein [Candidatus Omnitrophica bacterium]|nr:GvpL/GvpF family gas vesicle protein [Candidatus Omnitrophota bacterium]